MLNNLDYNAKSITPVRQRLASKTAEEYESVTDNLQVLVDYIYIPVSACSHDHMHLPHFVQLKQGTRNACNIQYQYKTYNSKDDTKIDKENRMGCVL